MISNRRTALALAALLTTTLATAATAANITYAVNRTVGAGSVVGSITTDGATGVLGAGDIVSFNLELNGVGASYNLVSPSSVDVVGGDLTATTHALSFDFSGADNGYFLLQQGAKNGQSYYCNAVSSAVCLTGESDVPQGYTDPSAQIVARSGTQVIGVAGVPEPATWAIMLLGMTILGGSLRSRSRVRAAA